MLPIPKQQKHNSLNYCLGSNRVFRNDKISNGTCSGLCIGNLLFMIPLLLLLVTCEALTARLLFLFYFYQLFC